MILLTVLAAAFVIAHSISILNRLHWSTHDNGYAHFLGYGLGHVAIASGALLAAIDALNGTLSLACIVVLLACSALIMFDRRRPRR